MKCEKDEFTAVSLNTVKDSGQPNIWLIFGEYKTLLLYINND